MHRYIHLVHDSINTFLKKLYNKEDLIILVNNKQINDKLQNHILMNIIGINKVELDISNGTSYIMQGNDYIQKQQPEYYNILVGFHSTFYEENNLQGLELLSNISSFINNNRKFSNQNFPIMVEKNIDTFFVNSKILTIAEENDIWQKIKLPYMPTLFYEIGLITILPPIEFSTIKVKKISSF